MKLLIRLRQYEIDKQIKRWSHVIRDIALLLQSDVDLSQHATQEELFQEATHIFNERDLLTDYLQGFAATDYADQMHKQVGDYFVKKQEYQQALQHYLVVSPLPLQDILSVATLLGNSALYLAEVYANLKEKDQRTRAIQKLCTALRNGTKSEIEKAAAIYVRLAVLL